MNTKERIKELEGQVKTLEADSRILLTLRHTIPYKSELRINICPNCSFETIGLFLDSAAWATGSRFVYKCLTCGCKYKVDGLDQNAKVLEKPSGEDEER